MGNALRLGISRIGLAWTKWRMKTKIRRKSISILILGLQESGKTTIALRLWKYKRTLPDLNYVQTKGFNTYAIRRKNKSTINLYDLGGHSSIQELWDHYYADAHGVIFVVDVSDREKIPEAGELFSKVLHDHRIRGKPVLLLANKQDLHGASEVELDSMMNLQEVVNGVRCLTRLDESAATDLKNDKGIFEGFKWLISYIEKQYVELNDRVMHDTLEEKNREKARRAAVKELMDQQRSTPTKSIDRPPSQKSQQSLKYLRKESSPDLDLTATTGKPLKNSSEVDEIGRTNYLIKSRPSSSTGETKNPFLIERHVSTAPVGMMANASRRSLPSIHLSGKKFMPFTTSRTQADSREILVKNSSYEDSGHIELGGTSAGGRLSPEGADSDEGIVNSAFEHEEVQSPDNAFVVPGAFHPSSKGVEDISSAVAPIGLASQCSPQPVDKVRKLIRTESSDTERPGEILMVTTLVQVHENQVPKESRRDSTTSTHDSVALSVSSFKSEETDGWKEDEEIPPSPPPLTLEVQPQKEISSQSAAALNSPSGGLTNNNIQTSSRLPTLDKGGEKVKRKYNLRPGRNKTAPLAPAAMAISTVESGGASASAHSTTSYFESPNRSGSGSSSGSRFSAMMTRNVGSATKRTRESVPNSGKSRLKKKSLSGFADSLETNPTSQFVREATLNQIERLKKY